MTDTVFSFQLTQTINPKVANSGGASLNMLNIEFWSQLFATLALLFTGLLLFKMVKVSNIRRRIELIANCLCEIDFRLSRARSAVSFIALSYLIYFMIFKSILSNNIKSNSVVSLRVPSEIKKTKSLKDVRLSSVGGHYPACRQPRRTAEHKEPDLLQRR